VFGIKDQQAREKLLRKANLTLKDTDDICRSHGPGERAAQGKEPLRTEGVPELWETARVWKA